MQIPIASFERMTLRERKKVDSPSLSKTTTTLTTSNSKRGIPNSVGAGRQGKQKDVQPNAGMDRDNNDSDYSAKASSSSSVETRGLEGGYDADSVPASVGVPSSEQKRSKKVILHVKPPSQSPS